MMLFQQLTFATENAFQTAVHTISLLWISKCESKTSYMKLRQSLILEQIQVKL